MVSRQKVYGKNLRLISDPIMSSSDTPQTTTLAFLRHVMTSTFHVTSSPGAHDAIINTSRAVQGGMTSSPAARTDDVDGNGVNSTRVEVSVEQFLQQKNDEFTVLVLPAIVILGILFLVGVVGNSMVLYVYNRKFHKGTIRWFVQALAIFDLLSCLVAIPGEIIDMRNNYTFGSSPMCKVLRTVSMFCTVASGMTLMVVAVERYKRICTPLGKQITPRGAQVIITVSAVAASICAAPASIIYGPQTIPTSNPAINGSDCSTADVFLGSGLPLAFSSFQFLLFTLGALALVVLYSLIGRKVWSHARFRRVGFHAGVHRRMSFFLNGSDCSSPTTEDLVFAFPGKSKNHLPVPAPPPAAEENSNTSQGHNGNDVPNDNNNVPVKQQQQQPPVVVVAPVEGLGPEVAVTSPVYPKPSHPPDDGSARAGEKPRLTEQPSKAEEPQSPDKEVVESLERPVSGKSLERPVLGKSLDRPVSGKSLERPVSGKSLDRPVSGKSSDRSVSGKSLDRPVSGKNFERPVSGKSLDRPVSGKSFDRQVSSEPPSSPTNAFSPGLDTFRRCKAPSRTASRDRIKSGDSAVLRGRYQRRPPQHTQSDMRRFLHRSESVNSGTRRTTLMLFLITVVYLLSFLPYLVLMIVKVLDEESLSGRGGGWELAHNILLRSYFINSMANPIIYSFCSRTFRKECFKVLHCRCCRSPLFVR